MSADTEWAVFVNEHFYHRPTFAAVFVRDTAKRVVFIRRPEREDAREETRDKRCMIIRGLTEDQATKAVAEDRLSLERQEREITEARQRHNARRLKIMGALKSEAKP